MVADFNDDDDDIQMQIQIKDELERIFDNTTEQLKSFKQKYSQIYPAIDTTMATFSFMWIQEIIEMVLDAYRVTGDLELFKRMKKGIAAIFRLTIRGLMPWNEFEDYMNAEEMLVFDQVMDRAATDENFRYRDAIDELFP